MKENLKDLACLRALLSSADQDENENYASSAAAITKLLARSAAVVGIKDSLELLSQAIDIFCKAGPKFIQSNTYERFISCFSWWQL